MEWIKRKKKIKNKKELGKQELEMITINTGGQYMYSGVLYDSDIVKSCIRAKVRAMGKIEAKHIRRNKKTIEMNPDAYITNLLNNPNPFMSGKQYREKMITQLELNGNAFARIYRDKNGIPIGRMPITCNSVRALYDTNEIRLEFYMQNGKRITLPYRDVIHYRHDYNSDDLFGDSPAPALKQLMEVVNTVDAGIISAVKNGQLIRFLLKFLIPMNQEKMKGEVKKFKETFMTAGDDTYGIAAVDSTAEIKDLNTKDYIPNGIVFTQAQKRIINLFGTNEKIISSDFSEDDWNSYYEATVEPDVIEMATEDTRKLFSSKDALTNKIVYEASNLSCASFKTRIELQAMVDRGALTPNEWREIFNRTPLSGGDKPIRRLDTEVVNIASKLLDKGADVNKIMNLLEMEMAK